MCPYDTETLDPAVVEEALRSHPVVTADGARLESASYGGLEAAPAQFQLAAARAGAAAEGVLLRGGRAWRRCASTSPCVPRMPALGRGAPRTCCWP